MRQLTQFMFIVVVAVQSTGCTHTQLMKNTVHQSETLSDVYQQQVMDNLAKFVYDHESMPDFAFPSSGTTNVTDQASGSTVLGWVAAGFSSVGLTISGNRSMLEGWTMDPVRDPHKLALMRCAYQHAVAACGYGETSSSCPNCDELLKGFHAHDSQEGGLDDTCIKNLSEYPWFGAGSKKDVPKDCGCIHVGHYCDQYVWVLPGNRDKLTQLTLAILDYAVNNPPEAKQKEVVVTVERDASDKIVKTTRKETSMEDVKQGGQTIFRRPVPTRNSGGGVRGLQQQLNNLGF